MTTSSLLRLLGLLLVAHLLWSPNEAHAYHDEETPSLEDSAYLLRSREWLLGPFQLAVGLGPFELNTRTAPWIIGAALGKAMPNFGAAATLYQNERLAVSVNAALYYVNSRKLLSDEQAINLWVFPMQASLSVRINPRHTVSAHFQYVQAVSSAAATQDDLELNGGAIADNAQISASWEWRFTRVIALLFSLHYLPYQGTPVLTSTATVDAQTDVTVNARLNVEDMQNSVAGSVSGLFSWQHLNVRIGIGYGAIFLSGPGLVLPALVPYPELALYWRL